MIPGPRWAPPATGRGTDVRGRRLALRRPARAVRLRYRSEEGNAPVEFIGWVLVLVVPVLYLLVTLSQVQAASFATVSAVDAASRILEVEQGDRAMSYAQVAVGLALSDQEIEADPAEVLRVSCADTGCSQALVRVEVGVDLPVLSWAGIGQDVVVMDAERVITLAGDEEQGR